MAAVHSRENLPQGGDVVKSVEVNNRHNSAVIKFYSGESVRVSLKKTKEGVEDLEQKMKTLFPNVDYHQGIESDEVEDEE